jgi:hypothetical protein
VEVIRPEAETRRHHTEDEELDRSQASHPVLGRSGCQLAAGSNQEARSERDSATSPQAADSGRLAGPAPTQARALGSQQRTRADHGEEDTQAREGSWRPGRSHLCARHSAATAAASGGYGSETVAGRGAGQPSESWLCADIYSTLQSRTWR